MSTQLTRRRALLVAGIAGSGAIAASAGPAHAERNPASLYSIQNMGRIPLESVATFASDFHTLDDGTQAAFLGVNGTPVSVAQIDPYTREVAWQYDLPGSTGGTWGVRAQSDGTVFAGTWSQGVLYRKLPGATAFESLGRVAHGVTWIWDLAVDDEGSVYIAAYFDGATDARIFRWREGEGFRDYGVTVPGATHVQTLTYHAGVVYAGTHPVNKIVRLDPESGEITSLPPAPTPLGRLQDLRVVDEVLWSHMSGASTRAFDLQSDTWLPVNVPGFGRGISDIGPDGRVYVDSHTHGIVAVDPGSGQWESVGAKPEGETFMMEWFDDPDGSGHTLVGFQSAGRLLTYSPDHGVLTHDLTGVRGAAAYPRALAEGPDGELWASSYMIHNYIPFDPSSEAWGEQVVMAGQGDAMLAIGDDLWIGSYSGALLWRYDPSVPVGPSNPVQVANLGSSHGQDRIHALGNLEGRVLVGSIPGYGQLGGTLAVHDPATGGTSAWRNIVPGHSITSVLGHDGKIIAGTSVYGGLGIAPNATDAVLVVVEPGTGEVLDQITPVPGQRAIRQILIGTDGALWGLAGGDLFRVDLSSLQVRVVRSIATVDWDSLDHYWEHGYLAVNPLTRHLTGIAGVGSRARVFDYDLRADELTILATPGNHPFAQHSNGDLYWTDGFDLVRARPNQAPKGKARRTRPNS